MDDTIQTYRVDFNDVGGENGDMIEVVIGTKAPVVGGSAVLYDVEHNRCWATVESVDGQLATLTVRDETWTEPFQVEPAPSLDEALDDTEANEQLRAWGDLLERNGTPTSAPQRKLEPVPA